MNKRNKKIFLIFLIFSLILSLIPIINIFNEDIKLLTLNKSFIFKMSKVLIIGDSRMELIENDREKLNIPSNIIIKAKSGARIEWFYKVGLPWLNEQLNNKDDYYNYVVLFNLGVNDLNSYKIPEEVAKEYINAYKSLMFQNKNIKFYFLSVNPIDELTINDFFANQKRTNKKIESFNKYFIDKLQEFDNVKYCDSYNEIDIKFYDGLHFDFNTNKLIVKYLINDCLNI